MARDSHGLTLSTSSAEANAAFDRTILGYLKFRTDTPQHLARTLAADPEFGLAHCVKGYFAMLSYKQASVPRAAEAARAAGALTASATARERAHVQALDAWVAGDIDRAVATWEAVLIEHPTDALALRLAHFSNFWLGRAREMRVSVERALPKWHPDLPGYATILACRSFAEEECGDLVSAERSGLEAIETEPDDLWAAHAVAHVMEMQGRRDDGIAMLETLAPLWAGGNNIVHHLWWHRAMFHLERREFDAALDLYDQRFRDLAAPLTQAQPDLYLDVQNAASMLFRLERQGIDVGDRWTEIADKAEARIGDCLSAFTLPHWAMALAATGRQAAAERMLAAMRDFGRGEGTAARIVGDVAVPIAEAALAHRRRDYSRAVDLMKPALGEMHRLGGSHAQQDVLEQLFLDAAMKAERSDDVRLALARAAARYPIPPDRRIGYAEAARMPSSRSAPSAP